MATTPNPDIRQSDGSNDRRWVVVTLDGSVNTLGRSRDPDDDEIAAMEATLES
jgi:hypothetical protein